tara:strand:+ start:573 stop:2318 length:1746 start_codon:yes stop_codon:yes gene_type:complete
MKRILFTILILIQFLFSIEDYFILDSLHSDIDVLLNYEKESKKFSTKLEKVHFFNSIAFKLYDKVLNLQDNTRDIINEYNHLINNLEERLGINKTSLSYDLGAPIIDTHFKNIPFNSKTIKNNLHYIQTESIKDQYLKLSRYRESIINVCEKRVDELLSSLDEVSIDNLFNNTVLDKHIIVMNFNNLSNNEKYDKLISIFPEIIINRYKNRDDISVTYSGSIEPDLRKIITDTNQSLRFLIDGSFFIDGYDIKINFKVYDIHDWSLKANQNLSCDIRNIDCVYDSFLWSIKESVDPLIVFEQYSDFSDYNTKVVGVTSIDSMMAFNKKSKNLFEPILENYAIQKDYSFDISYQDMGIDQNVSIKTQTFDLENYPNGIKSRKDLSIDLFEKLESYLSNPYQIDIGTLKMDLNQYDNSYVELNVPITYRFKKREFEKIIKKLPYNTIESTRDFYAVEFLYDDYLFDLQSINLLNRHESELFPVLFFTNRDGNIQKIVIDSWDSKYDNLLFGDYDVNRVNNFVQLYSIIKSGKDMHLNIDKNKIKLDYKITMPVTVLDNYTRLTVKIFKRSDLDAYLPIDKLRF